MLPRDWELLAFLEEQGFATYEQLKTKFFNGMQPNCSNRLKKLQFFGYIDKKKLIDFFKDPRGKEGSRPGYFPHILNLNIKSHQYIYFIGRKYCKGFGKSGQLFKPSMILHQLILNDIRAFLEKTIVHKMILNDPKAKIIASTTLGIGSDTVPDLSFDYEHVKIAVEVERTPKTKSRYFQRFNAFRHSEYSHVIYYYTRESQLKVLMDYAGLSPQFAFAHYKFPNELYSNIFGTIDLNGFIHKVLEQNEY